MSAEEGVGLVSGDNNISGGRRGSLEVKGWGDTLARIEVRYSLWRTGMEGHLPQEQRGVCSVKQDIGDGRIGATLWASAVVLSR